MNINVRVEVVGFIFKDNYWVNFFCVSLVCLECFFWVMFYLCRLCVDCLYLCSLCVDCFYLIKFVNGFLSLILF